MEEPEGSGDGSIEGKNVLSYQVHDAACAQKY